jgi:hypothetical protein
MRIAHVLNLLICVTFCHVPYLGWELILIYFLFLQQCWFVHLEQWKVIYLSYLSFFVWRVEKAVLVLPELFKHLSIYLRCETHVNAICILHKMLKQLSECVWMMLLRFTFIFQLVQYLHMLQSGQFYTWVWRHVKYISLLFLLWKLHQCEIHLLFF